MRQTDKLLNYLTIINIKTDISILHTAHSRLTMHLQLHLAFFARSDVRTPIKQLETAVINEPICSSCNLSSTPRKIPETAEPPTVSLLSLAPFRPQWVAHFSEASGRVARTPSWGWKTRDAPPNRFPPKPAASQKPFPFRRRTPPTHDSPRTYCYCCCLSHGTIDAGFHFALES